MVQSDFCKGLAGPRGTLIDYSQMDSFLGSMVTAILQLDAELSKVRDENVALKKTVGSLSAGDSQTLKLDVVSLTRDITTLNKKISALEQRLSVSESNMQEKAGSQELQEVRELAELASRSVKEAAANIMKNETFKSDTAKQFKEIRGQVNDLSNRMTEQIGGLAESKASKAELFQISEKADGTVQQCERNTVELKDVLRSTAEFMSRAEAELAKKVGFEAIKDKMGRMECDDLLKSLSNEFGDKIRRANKLMQEMREDIDVLLTMIMQDANMGAGTTIGMVHCISCQKPVAVHRPGPSPGTGREPIIVQGKDRQMYRAAKDPDSGGGSNYSPIWQSSQISVARAPSAAADYTLPAASPSAAPPTERTAGAVHERRASADAGDRRSPGKPTTPATAAADKSGGRVRPASAKVRVPPL